MPKPKRSERGIPNLFRAWSYRFGHAVYLYGKQVGKPAKYVRKYRIDGGEESVAIGTFGTVGYSHTNYNSGRSVALKKDKYCALENAVIYDIDRMYYGLSHWNDRPDILKKPLGRASHKEKVNEEQCG